jgi:hypothetical protein
VFGVKTFKAIHSRRDEIGDESHRYGSTQDGP